MRCLLPLYEILLPEAIMSVARSRLIQRFGRDWMIYALFHCGVEYLISQNSGFWDSLYDKQCVTRLDRAPTESSTGEDEEANLDLRAGFQENTS